MAANKGTTSRRSQQDEYLGKVVAGRYRLETLLGEGGMGVVYRARHVLIDRVVALKLIRPDLRGETHLRAWMLREARAANRVDHAHIVDIHDVGETEEGELYLVMEYLTGSSLSHECSKGPMPLTRAVDILEQMCAALARAHDLGVIHRDLKSDNIMLTTRGGRRDFVKILDFGLAALARDPRLAPKGAVFGTPEYMSPEQARGEDATARQRSVRARHPVLRDDHGSAAVPLERSRDPARDAAHRAGPAAAPAARRSAGSGREHHPEAAREGSAQALPRRPPSTGRAQGVPALAAADALGRALGHPGAGGAAAAAALGHAPRGGVGHARCALRPHGRARLSQRQGTSRRAAGRRQVLGAGGSCLAARGRADQPLAQAGGDRAPWPRATR